MNTWHNENGEWLVKVENGDFPVHMVGQPTTVTTRSGRKSRVVLGEHVRGWLVAGGRHVDLYRATTEGA